MNIGYYSVPSVFRDQIIFASEEDLWTVPLAGGEARRLTAGRGGFFRTVFSPDGQWIAASGEEEGYREIYVLPADGGDARRVTYLGARAEVSAWVGDEIYFSSDACEPCVIPGVYRVNARGGAPEALRMGAATSIAFSKRGAVVIERNSHRPDPAHWKRYRGGTAGRLWTAKSFDGEFREIKPFEKTNLSRPFFAGARVFFLADPEGMGNLYSCALDGSDLKQHTRRRDFYARNATTDGRTVVYQAGGDIYALDLRTNRERLVRVKYNSQRTQRSRRFASAETGFEDFALSPKGDRLSVSLRGHVLESAPWEGPIRDHCPTLGVRGRLGAWTGDGKAFVLVTDEGAGEGGLEVHRAGKDPQKLHALKLGRITRVNASPDGKFVAVANHRNELWLIHLERKTRKLIDRDAFAPMGAVSFSPDGRWLAYSVNVALRLSQVRILEVASGKKHDVTRAEFGDFCPDFDPEGRYLYLLTNRDLNPVYDAVQFELAFMKSTVAALITLRKDHMSPLICSPEPPPAPKGKHAKTPPKLRVDIDFAGIEDRMIRLPTATARYTDIVGLPKGRVLLSSLPVEGALHSDWMPGSPAAKRRLEIFDLADKRTELLWDGVSDFALSNDRNVIALRIGHRVRVADLGTRPPLPLPPAPEVDCSRKSGWVRMARFQTAIDPPSEWKQILHEAWRLQRDFFWEEGMGRVDWNGVLKRYEPLLDRISTRMELTDLIWEIQGELGTSHAYVMRGDLRQAPLHRVGFLGADFVAAANGLKIRRVLAGDSWNAEESSPLASPGVNLSAGSIIVSVDGQAARGRSAGELLLNKAGREVALEVQSPGAKKARTVVVRAAFSEAALRYRDWVRSRAARVEAATKGRVGYLHIPDMAARGFAEFHRHFLAQFDKDALIVDMRFNGGGHVSQLLLEKLARERVGFHQSRWFGRSPTPDESPTGVMVALTNENAGSDGDMGSHCFKLRKLGPLIGKRTWGGVVGIWPRQLLLDGGVTTQPEFSHWFKDVGWDIENHGTDPDIEVDISPHEARAEKDPQLEKGIEVILEMLESSPPWRPGDVAPPDRSR